MSERNEKIAALYYAGYSRRALVDAFGLSQERIRQVLASHARHNGLRWPPPRYDHPKHFKPIPPHLLK